MMDFLFIADGFHFLVEPKNPTAEEWLSRHTGHDSNSWSNRLFVESRYAYPLAEGMREEGFQVEFQ